MNNEHEGAESHSDGEAIQGGLVNGGKAIREDISHMWYC